MTGGNKLGYHGDDHDDDDDEMMMMMVTQLIPTSHIPTRWEYVIMMKGGNMTQSHSHHTHR